MLRSRHQRGESQFGCLIGLVILLIACVLAYKLIPVKVKAADMRDTMVDELVGRIRSGAAAGDVAVDRVTARVLRRDG